MSLRSNLVNLDAMIAREDFATTDAEQSNYDNVTTISLRDFTSGGLIGPSLRKPDFQRETNHWTPDQVVSLLECFINGDLIPSVILWQSPAHLFVIDGGHRLSVLKAWVLDDYGDGHISQTFFGYQISDTQKKVAKRTRDLVKDRVGAWTLFQTKIADQNLDASERKKLAAIVSRGLPIQWVKGDADKAESSFFKINTEGTPLDDIEELLLKNRRKPISIAARSIIRAGAGHKYWSAFAPEKAHEIELLAKDLHSVLFDPEVKTPTKTLDLPLGGPKGVRAALQVLIDVILISNRNQNGEPKGIDVTSDDVDGSETIRILTKTLKLAKRITGNDGGSLGLHPVVYFYGPTGRHSGAMFMGTVLLIGKKLLNNDATFFKTFTSVRSKVEAVLVDYKDLIATILQKHVSAKRIDKYATLLNGVIEQLAVQGSISEADLVRLADLEGKIVIGKSTDKAAQFSDDAKSEAYIKTALASAIKCPLCDGFLDPAKSISYDHVIRKREGGAGSAENCNLTHPYCNQAVKN